MKFKNPKIETLYEYFSKITIEAYKDPYLISNAILSKQKTKENILESYLENKIPIKTSLLFVFKKLLIYFFKNIVLLILTIISSIFHRFSGQSWNARSNVEYIFLDTFFSVPNILKTNKFEDHYFPGLSEYLIKIKKNYVIIPKILGSKNPFVLFRIFKILNNQKIPAITHYQALCFFDYLKALKFIIFYPFFIFRTIQNLGTNPEDKLTRSALFENLDCSVLDNYLRFLFAQRLTFLVSGPIKCISWFENVSGDKNFFWGYDQNLKILKLLAPNFF